MTNIYQDFPILNQRVNDEDLVYLDNAATTQKPQAVIDALEAYYLHDNANIHRGVHTLANRATEAYERTRDKVQAFINAAQREEIIFTKGTTQGLNWIARSFADKVLEAGDEILISPIEHHSNLIPWQEAAKRNQAKLRYLEMNQEGVWTAEDLKEAISDRTKILAISHVSNVLGSAQDIQALAQVIHDNQGYIVVDGAQGAAHLPVDVQALDCDFYCFSAHKVYGPTGVGVLYGKRELLEDMEPLEYGGEMITLVQRESSTWAELPYKFEGGTQNIAGVVAFSAALDWIESVGGMAAIADHEKELTRYAMAALADYEAVAIYGSADPDHHHGVISFNLAGVHPHDLATGLDQLGVAVRAGHHCAQVLMRELCQGATARASFAYYNTKADVDRLVSALKEVEEFFTDGFI
ncbi:aminotransferase class V-fold PLP-dependent enzyme [Aerococcus sanguinicola]|uniref:Cysteine desulfurase n=1 Tax=Aerococcus sanguinicola TaxID=119206 RepID=A0A0X8F9N7_9LACT|nr:MULTISPECIES: SufS family cysteine desulfurase [Aerococcus]AMB93350.1 cysteine desulfurase [Aerococcus sanguinicola]OFT92167.1 cysteine desulfurase [Aerococcus sp. HMSC23C02]PKZ23043.1 SufS family cysteine desulfurase [Aerococcus sanguinicola]